MPATTGMLKALASRCRIAGLLIHHLRKLNGNAPMNKISGGTGLRDSCFYYSSPPDFHIT